ncbi:MAG: hypothetical protein WDN25_05890 [Acetobacteraceae bacterium]
MPRDITMERRNGRWLAIACDSPNETSLHAGPPARSRNQVVLGRQHEDRGIEAAGAQLPRRVGQRHEGERGIVRRDVIELEHPHRGVAGGLLAGGITMRRPRRSVRLILRPRSALANTNSGWIWMLPML